MSTENKEYEIVIQNNHITMDKLKEKIKSLGGEMVQEEKVFFHFVYRHPYKGNHNFIRLRNEYNHITLTYKIHSLNDFPIEHEVVVKDFNSANKILELLGCKKKYECHKLREIWKLEGCKEIVFDTYPGIETYAELECNSKEDIISSLERLELDTDISKYKRLFASQYYKDMYGIISNSKEKLSFKTAYNVLLEKATKNQDILKERLDVVNEKHKEQINLLE